MLSLSVVSNSLWPHGLQPTRYLCPLNFPVKSSGVGSQSLLQRIFLTQGSNPGLPHRRQILYQLSHKGSPRILEWVAYPFSRGFSEPSNQTRISCIAGKFFTNWAIREAQNLWKSGVKICHFSKHQPSVISEKWLLRIVFYLEDNYIFFVDFSDSSDGKESTCDAGDPSLIPGSGRSPGEGIGDPLQYSWASLVTQLIKNLPAVRETWVWSLGWEDPLQKGKATHSSILAWGIPRIV